MAVQKSRVQVAAAKAKAFSHQLRQTIILARELKAYHVANNGGDYGAGMALNSNDPSLQALDDSEGFIQESGGVSRNDFLIDIGVAFDLVAFADGGAVATQERESVIQRVAG